MVVTRGYGNGTFNGTITDVVLRGYTIGAAVDLQVYTAQALVNISPAANVNAQLSPTADTLINISPSVEVKSG